MQPALLDPRAVQSASALLSDLCPLRSESMALLALAMATLARSKPLKTRVLNMRPAFHGPEALFCEQPQADAHSPVLLCPSSLEPVRFSAFPPAVAALSGWLRFVPCSCAPSAAAPSFRQARARARAPLPTDPFAETESPMCAKMKNQKSKREETILDMPPLELRSYGCLFHLAGVPQSAHFGCRVLVFPFLLLLLRILFRSLALFCQLRGFSLRGLRCCGWIMQ